MEFGIICHAHDKMGKKKNNSINRTLKSEKNQNAMSKGNLQVPGNSESGFS